MKNTFLSIVLGFAVLSLTGCATTPPATDQAPEPEPQAEAEGTAAPAGTEEPVAGTQEPALDGEPPEDHVARRGRERWDHIAAAEYDLAYEYLSPGYRDKMSRTAYIVKLAGQRVRWKDADFEKVECDPEICRVSWVIHWTYNIPVRGAGAYDGEKPTVENWILADGEWYFVPSL
jgi:hypothetical protein